MNIKNTLTALALLLTSLQVLAVQGHGTETTPLNQQAVQILTGQTDRDHVSSNTETTSEVNLTKKPLRKKIVHCCSMGCGKVCFNPLIVPCCIVGGFIYISAMYFLVLKN